MSELLCATGLPKCDPTPASDCQSAPCAARSATQAASSPSWQARDCHGESRALLQPYPLVTRCIALPSADRTEHSCRRQVDDSARTEQRRRTLHGRIRPDQQVIQSHDTVADEWRPAGLCMNVIGHQQAETTTCGTAGADAMEVDQNDEQDEIVAHETSSDDVVSQIFSCIDNSHAAITQAYLAKVLSLG